ncbi:MAG TPA: SDR family oxidoreductase [Pyrinomonadaceae bacterium]|nr:SDR family oxidoreductase [Pyrinomonadaceae bacterium]
MLIVLITGSSTGIGMATALNLATKGHKVYASMRNPAGGGDLLSAAAAAGVAVELVQLDVTDEASVEKAVAEILEREGRIDVLVNNAGIGPLGPVEEMSIATFKNVYETNVFGVVRCVQAVLPAMRKQQSGSIVNISSVAGQISSVCSGAYASSKFALEGLSEALAQEVRPFGIHVAIVEPGFIITPIIDKALAELSTHSDSAYPYAVKIANDLFTSGQQTGDPAEMVAKTVEEAINDKSLMLRYPVGDPAQGLLAARADMKDEEWVDLGRHKTLDAFFGEFLSHMPQPSSSAAR